MLIVATGREVISADKQSKMPALGDNPNVRCYIEDIYIYLKARCGRRAAARPPGQAGRQARGCREAREGLLRMTLTAPRR